MANEYAVNQSDLAQVANAIRIKGETTNQLVFPSGFVDTIQKIQVGVTVQQNAGTFTTAANGTATINCGFRPDVVIVDKGETNNGETFSSAFAFEAVGRENKINAGLYTYDVASFYLYDIYAQSMENGFNVEISEMDYDFDFHNAGYVTFNYVAIKYTK
jgi:hypothetical protein